MHEKRKSFAERKLFSKIKVLAKKLLCYDSFLLLQMMQCLEFFLMLAPNGASFYFILSIHFFILAQDLNLGPQNGRHTLYQLNHAAVVQFLEFGAKKVLQFCYKVVLLISLAHIKLQNVTW